VLTPAIVNNDTLPKRNVSDDIFTPKRIAAACTRGQQVIDTFHDDRILAHADKLLDRLHPGLEASLFSPVGVELFEPLRSQKLCQNVSRQRLSVPDRCKQILRPSKSVLVGDSLHFDFIVKEFLRREFKAVSFFFEEFAADIDRFNSLLLRDPMANA